MAQSSSTRSTVNGRRGFGIAFICLVGALLLFFAPSLTPGKVLFANDGPLGANMAGAVQPPGSMNGIWWDLNWVGTPGGSYVPSFTFFILWPLGPVLFAKFYPPICLLFLGFSAWLFFRQMRWNPAVALIAGIAAMLNMNVFSNVCWGLGTRALCLGSTFLGLAAFEASKRHRYPWLFLIAGGLAVGMAVCEGADNGAIYSLYLAAYVAFSIWQEGGKSAAAAGKAIASVAVVAAFAGVLAAQSIGFLVPTAVKTVSHAQVTPETKEADWNFATQWSLPRKEIIRVAIPGIFGYRMDTPNGGQYWGEVGQQPGWEQHHQGYPRYSGSGEYAGIIVLLIAAWAAAQSFRATGSTYSVSERRAIQFWLVAAFISVLFSFGRHAPFFKIMYSLPYFSTIRNPIKFMHPFHLALLVMFGYGLEDLFRRLTVAKPSVGASMVGQLKTWWKSTAGFEKKFAVALLAFFAVSVFGFLIYSSLSREVFKYMTAHAIGDSEANQIIGFSKGEIGLYLLFLAGSTAIFLLIVSGAFAGPRMKWAAILIAVLLVIDMARANAPWVRYYDYRQKYASNAVIDFLASKVYEHRVATRLTPMGQVYLSNNQMFPGLMNDWMQHLFQYYNLHSLDIIQWPRMPEFDRAYLDKFRPVSNEDLTGPGRILQLSNTRFLLGMKGFLPLLNQNVDPVGQPFRVHTSFDVVPKPGISEPKNFDELTVQTKPEGQYALFEYTRALPRALLLSKWQVSSNDQAALNQLADRSFDASQLVVVSDQVSMPPSPITTNASGTVEFTSYQPKSIKLHAKSDAASILLLNDRYDPEWKVYIDGSQGKLLRCNYIMRGVALPAGEHRVEFRYEPALHGLYSTLAGLALGILLCCIVPFIPERGRASTPSAGNP